MPKQMKEITTLWLSECPLCGADKLSIVEGGRILFIKLSDSVRCRHCDAKFKVGADEKSVYLDYVPSLSLHLPDFLLHLLYPSKHFACL